MTARYWYRAQHICVRWTPGSMLSCRNEERQHSIMCNNRAAFDPRTYCNWISFDVEHSDRLCLCFDGIHSRFYHDSQPNMKHWTTAFASANTTMVSQVNLRRNEFTIWIQIWREKRNEQKSVLKTAFGIIVLCGLCYHHLIDKNLICTPFDMAEIVINYRTLCNDCTPNMSMHLAEQMKDSCPLILYDFAREKKKEWIQFETLKPTNEHIPRKTPQTHPRQRRRWLWKPYAQFNW